MATETDYTRKCQQLDVLIDLLEKENKRLKSQKIEWIPCNKRLPEKEGLYLVTRLYMGGVSVVTKFYYIEEFGGYWNRTHSDRVLAWSPLPEPYKEDAQ